MAKELEAMELNNTWTILSLHNGKHATGCKWVYKVKYKSNGSIERYEARLVAKRYTQQECLDFIEAFSTNQESKIFPNYHPSIIPY